MDIWSWVSAAGRALPEEEGVLRRRLDRLPSWVLDQENAMVDAVVPEMLADIRRLQQPWLEVFVRHWRLQSWVFQRQLIDVALPEAVDLLERAHREDTAGCPQTVCVAQDICASYGYADGPGYGEKRIEVSDETLSRIDASWPCFTCITGEKLSALNDLGRYDEALALIASASDAMRDAGNPPGTADFAWSQALALRHLGRIEEALEVVERAWSHAKGKGFEREKRLRLVLLNALLGNPGPVRENLVPYAEIEDSPGMYVDWAEAVFAAVEAGMLEWGPEGRGTFARSASRLRAQGCPRDALRIALWGAELARSQGEKSIGRAFVELAEGARAELVADHGALEAVAHVARGLQGLEEPVLPDTIEGLTAEAGLRFDVAVAATRRWPDAVDLVIGVARHWRISGFPTRAREAIEGVLAAHPADPDVFQTAGSILLEAGDLETLDRLVDGALPDVALQADWIRASLSEKRGDPVGAIAALEAASTHPDAGWAVFARLGKLREASGDRPGALRAYGRAVEAGAPSGEVDWDRMVVARILGDHAAVRESCGRLDIALESSAGPVEEAWGYVRLQYPEDARRTTWAERTGPVTATVVSILGPGAEERHGDRVVFRPRALDDGEPPLFEVVEVVEPGGYEAFALDGCTPGDAELTALRRELTALGIVSRPTHSEHYRLRDPELGVSRPGLYLRMAVPVAEPGLRRRLGDVLTAFQARTEAPLVWLELLEALGDPALEAQRELASRWGI